MNKVLLIIWREYLTRVRKRSFIIMSILGPVIFAAFMVVPAWMAMSEDQEVKNIAIVDSSAMFMNVIPETEDRESPSLRARINSFSAVSGELPRNATISEKLNFFKFSIGEVTTS